MKRYIIYFLLFLVYSSSSDAQMFDWVTGGGSNTLVPSGSSDESVYAMCTDYNGNVYVLSSVGSSPPIVADTFLSPTGSYGSYENVMFASYTCEGQMRFAKVISGSKVVSHGIVCDTAGRVYVALFARHGSSASTTLRIGYDTSIAGVVYQTQMLVQYDTTGHMNWLRFVGDNTLATLAGGANSRNCFVAVDGDNDVHYINTIGYGVPITPTLTSHSGTYDLKYDASGALLSVHKLQIDSSLVDVQGISLDKNSGKLYTVGTRLISRFPDSSYYPYIASFDTARNLIWKDTLAISCYSGPGYAIFAGITTDNSGNLYMSGTGSGCVTYRGHTFTNALSGRIAFILKTDTSGNVNWMKGFSGSSSINAFASIALTPNGNVAASGVMTGTILTDTDTLVSYSGEGQNAHFVVMDTAGYIDTIQQLHGTGFYDLAHCIISDRTGNLYVGGEVGTSTWAGSLVPYTSIGGNSDFFVMKYGVDCDCVSMPVASYTDTGTLVRGFTYTGTTTGIDSVRWDFGDGGTSTLLNPIHTYITADTFSACVRVYTSCGSDLYCSDIEIPCITPPVASYVMSGTGLTRSFTYTGTPAGIDSVTWGFSDGGTDVGGVVSHSFASAATYTVCVTAHTPCGTHTACTSVSITCTASPVSAFTVSTGAGLTKSFVYTGTTAGMDSVTWDFGDGNTGTGLTPANTYTAAGTYTVCATVHTNCGTHTACTTIGVTCVTPPAASFTLSGSDLSRNFTYTGTTAGMDSVRWDFGDGSTTTIVNPLHAFASAGTYTVCVTVYTNCGSDTYCSPVTVACATLPTASFTYAGTGATRSFLYTGTTAGMDSVRWHFGDGGTATVVAPSHTYTAEGTYSICVYVFTNCGSDTFCQSVNVNCFLPITSAFNDTGALVHGFSYTGAMAGYDSVVWDFGDGVTDTGLHAIHTYAVADTYHVCATVYTECGINMVCKDVIVNYPTGVPGISLQQVQVFPNPVTQELHVSGLHYKTCYTIYNVVGVKLEKGQLQPAAAIIQTTALPPGVYLLQLSAKSGYRKTVQFIKR